MDYLAALDNSMPHVYYVHPRLECQVRNPRFGPPADSLPPALRPMAQAARLALGTAREGRVAAVEVLLGAVIVALTAMFALETILRSSGRRLVRGPAVTRGARVGMMVVFSAIAALAVLPTLVPAARKGIFAFCGVCPIGTTAAGGPESFGEFLRVFLLATWYYTATVLPVFVLASLFSGLMIARWRRFRIRGLLPAFGLAAVLPVCSCGVIPIGKTMIDEGGRSARAGLVFIAAAPLLSPIIASLSLTLLGWRYLLVRVAASFLLAVGVALFVRPLLVDTPDAPAGRPVATTVGGYRGSVLLAAWGMLSGLLRYVLFGLVLGSLFTAAVPTDYVGRILESGIVSMATVVVVGIPINMCAGEEVLLSAPLVDMGLTMGHAVAFALASTGICIGSIPLLVNVLGRRGALAMVAVYLVVPFLLGIIINGLPFLRALGPAPF